MSDCAFESAIGASKGGIYLRVHVQPGAKRAGPCGMYGDALKIAVRQMAQDGRANRALLELVADGLGIARARVRLAGGAASRKKRLFVEGDAEALIRRLRAWLQDD